MRKGALWFVKYVSGVFFLKAAYSFVFHRDPQDPTFHPIRDILDRPTLSQLRKLSISAIMYSIVILVGVGCAVHILAYAWTPYHSLLPLRWDSRHPISELPIDLLFLHLVLPSMLESVDPMKIISPLAHTFWEHEAHEFRLTSFLFGDRIVEEEVASRLTWRRLPIVRDLKIVRNLNARDATGRHDVQDGNFARVPASDTVAFPEANQNQNADADERPKPPTRYPMLIPTNEAGAPFDQRGMDAIQAQDDAARKALRDPKEDYQVVYLPPNFVWRVVGFVLYLWGAGACGVVFALGTPILVGRIVLDEIIGTPGHDGYSLLVGSCVIWFVITCMRHGVNVGVDLDRTLRDEGNTIPSEKDILKASLRSTGRQLLGLLILAGKNVAIWTMIGLVIPLLLATVLQLYLVLPVRVAMYPVAEGSVVTLHLWEDWALGCVLASILVRSGHMQQPRTGLIRSWDQVGFFIAIHPYPS